MILPPATPGNITSATIANSDTAALRTAAAGFEEMFLVFLLRAGRATSMGDDLTGSMAVSATRDMLDAHLARSAAGQSGLGLADAVVRQFTPSGER